MLRVVMILYAIIMISVVVLVALANPGRNVDKCLHAKLN